MPCFTGLGTGKKGPWILSIGIDKDEDGVRFTVTDNGVGRKQAAALSNYRNHGTGIKNLESILEVINGDKEQKMTIQYEDGVFHDGNGLSGTRVIICLPQNFSYDS